LPRREDSSRIKKRVPKTMVISDSEDLLTARPSLRLGEFISLQLKGVARQVDQTRAQEHAFQSGSRDRARLSCKNNRKDNNSYRRKNNLWHFSISF
jgi:hypothetical protein